MTPPYTLSEAIAIFDDPPNKSLLRQAKPRMMALSQPYENH